MSKFSWSDGLLVAMMGLAGVLAWALTHSYALADSRQAVEQALRQARPASIEYITVFPFGPGPTRPFQLRTAAGIAPLLPALRQLAPLSPRPQPLATLPLATLSLRLTAEAAQAWHLRGRELIFRLSVSSQGDIAERASSPVVYQATALNQQVRHLRDSLSHR